MKSTTDNSKKSYETKIDKDTGLRQNRKLGYH